MREEGAWNRKSARAGDGARREKLLNLDELPATAGVLRGRLTGRPRDFGSRYLGSSPSPGAKLLPFSTLLDSWTRLRRYELLIAGVAGFGAEGIADFVVAGFAGGADDE